MMWAEAHSAVALAVPVLGAVGVVEVGVVGVVGVGVVGVDLGGEPVRPPRMLPTVVVTPPRSPWALAEPMPTSTQTTTIRRCIFQSGTRKGSMLRTNQPTHVLSLRASRVSRVLLGNLSDVQSTKLGPYL